MPEFKNILIIKPSAIGDIVHALPILANLKTSFPDSKITWLVREDFTSLIADHKNIDELIIFKRKLLGKWWHSKKSFNELLSLKRTLKDSKFDLVIDLQGLFRTALFAWLTGCKKRVGLKDARESATLFYTDSIAKPKTSDHIIDYYNHIIASLGADISSDIKFDISVNSDAENELEELLKEKGIENNKLIIFIPGAAHKFKCWPVEYFVKLAQRLSENSDYSIITVGSASEKDICQKITTLASVPVISLAGQTNIPQLVALLSKASMVVSNDTGPGHIAVALNTPSVIIFGPTNPQRLAPYNKPDSLVLAKPYNDPDIIKSRDPQYRIEKVSVDMVYDKICLQLPIEND